MLTQSFERGYIKMNRLGKFIQENPFKLIYKIIIFRLEGIARSKTVFAIRELLFLFLYFYLFMSVVNDQRVPDKMQFYNKKKKKLNNLK